MTLDNGETLIGVAGDPNDEINITSTDNSRVLCRNCKDRKHAIHGSKKKNGPIELLKERCSNSVCECRCLRYYEGRDGKLRRLGTVDDSVSEFDIPRKELCPIEDIIGIIQSEPISE